MNKICNCCNLEKSFEEFNKKTKSKDGLQSRCKKCASNYYDKNRIKILENSKEYYEKIKDTKAEYAKKYREQTKTERTAWQKEYYEANKIAIASYQKQYWETNKNRKIVYDQEYYLSNKDKRSVQQKEYYASNKGKSAARNAKRRAKKLQATPNWLTDSDIAEIEELYLCARIFKLYTGEDYHVDHIIPLQGKNVCGLHVPWNLQVIPAKENLSKSNKI
jgi:hypothetical protein